jgi:RNA polymerase sigma-70 factor, ECF subfamily
MQALDLCGVQGALMVELRDRLEAVYRAEGPRLWRALVGYAGDRDIASDAVAEAFAQALARGEDIRSIEAWVWRAAFRIAAGELKQRGKQVPKGTEPTYELDAPLDGVLDALRALSPNQRAAILLHDYADRPTAEVAATLGMSSATVYVHLSQGRRRLRKLMEDQNA